MIPSIRKNIPQTNPFKRKESSVIILPRKIDQLLNALVIGPDGKPVTLTMAKADDGTAWEFRSNPNRWEPLPPLPPILVLEPHEALPASPAPSPTPPAPSPDPALAPGPMVIAPAAEGGSK
jgi:hypothetical protein